VLQLKVITLVALTICAIFLTHPVAALSQDADCPDCFKVSPSEADEGCHAIAAFYQSAAAGRDEGMSKAKDAQTVTEMWKALRKANGLPTSTAELTAIKMAVNFVYSHPDATPDEAFASAFKNCLQSNGQK
jgi:hypothetical protein